ncbi:MAG: type I phosphomannose isomerase catalytic subunit [Candidatus Bruticola sp.]
MFLYPLKLKPYFVSRVWGGSYLAEHYAQSAPTAGCIGEIWTVCGEQPIVNGVYADTTLNELCQRFPRQFGNCTYNEHFPLLVKWLRAQQWLSVQVHPSDHLAAELSGADRGKEEAWYVAEADPGAQLILGVKSSVRCSQVLQSSGAELMSCLNKIKPAVGDCIHINPGLIHALGPGVTVLEVQQNSNLTYRLYDWDRLGLDGCPRSLHLTEAAAVLRRCWPVNLPGFVQGRSGNCQSVDNGASGKKVKGVVFPGQDFDQEKFASPIGQVVLSAENFRLEVIDLSSEPVHWLTDDVCPEIVICIRGCLQVYLHGEFEELNRGETCVLAAGSVKAGLTACPNGEAVRVICSRRVNKVFR